MKLHTDRTHIHRQVYTHEHGHTATCIHQCTTVKKNVCFGTQQTTEKDRFKWYEKDKKEKKNYKELEKISSNQSQAMIKTSCLTKFKQDLQVKKWDLGSSHC